jgi:hypothetical protein
MGVQENESRVLQNRKYVVPFVEQFSGFVKAFYFMAC